jgi:hypothetical protein
MRHCYQPTTGTMVVDSRRPNLCLTSPSRTCLSCWPSTHMGTRPPRACASHAAGNTFAHKARRALPWVVWPCMHVTNSDFTYPCQYCVYAQAFEVPRSTTACCDALLKLRWHMRGKAEGGGCNLPAALCRRCATTSPVLLSMHAWLCIAQLLGTCAQFFVCAKLGMGLCSYATTVCSPVWRQHAPWDLYTTPCVESVCAADHAYLCLPSMLTFAC